MYLTCVSLCLFFGNPFELCKLFCIFFAGAIAATGAATLTVAAATVSVAAPVAAMAPAKKMQKSLQSSNGLPKKRQRLTQVRYIKA